MTDHSRHSDLIWLLLILIVAASLRLYGIQFGKPDLLHPDEIKLVIQAGRLLETKFSDKEAFFGIQVYPPFYTYMLAGAVGIYILINLLTGHFSALTAVRTAYETDPFQFFLVSRLLVAGIGILAVFIIYAIAKRLYSREIALATALLVAVNYVLVQNSHFGTVDIPAMAWGMVCFYFAVRMMQIGKTSDYIGAAVTLAIAVAVKFNMIFLVFPIVFAHFSRFHFSEWLKQVFNRRLILIVLTSLATFCFACPLIWLDFRETWGGIVGTHQFERVGKIGSGGGLLSYWTGDQSPGFGVFYPNSFPTTFGVILTLLCAGGLFLLVLRRRRNDLFLLSYIIPMYLLFERMSIKAIRHIIPIMPFLLLAAVILVFAMSSRVKNKSLGSIILFSLLLGVSLSNGYRIFRYLDALKQTDPRTAARSWAQNNIPPNSIICVEGFPPFLDRQIDPLDQRQFRIRTIELTAKSLTIIPDFFDFLKQEERLYYIADGFTRQIFLWKHSQRRYKEIVANRMAFWAWLEEHGEVIQRFPSSHPPLQPEIIIYELRSSL